MLSFSDIIGKRLGPSQQRELYGTLTRFPIESCEDTTNRLQKYGLFHHVLDDHGNIVDEHVHRNGQQDDTEELTQNENQVGAKQLLHLVRHDGKALV